MPRQVSNPLFRKVLFCLLSNRNYKSKYYLMEDHNIKSQEYQAVYDSTQINILFTMLKNQIQNIIIQHQTSVANNQLSLRESYKQFYQRLFREIQITYSSTIVNNFGMLALVPYKLMNEIIENFRSTFNYVHKLIARQNNRKYTYNMKKNPYTSDRIQQICKKCEAVIAGKQIQYQKINLEYSQFQDPYNLFAVGMTQFQEGDEYKMLEGYNSEQNEEHRIKIQSHIQSIKKRIIKRSDEINEILNQFQKYYLNLNDRGQIKSSKTDGYYKTFDSCMREMISIFSEKIDGLIDKFRLIRQKKQRYLDEKQVQVDLAGEEIEKYEKKCSQLEKQLEDKKNQIFDFLDQKTELSLKINDFKSQLESVSKERAQMASKLIFHETESDTLKNECNQVKKRLSFVEKQKEECQERIKNLEDKFEDFVFVKQKYNTLKQKTFKNPSNPTLKEINGSMHSSHKHSYPQQNDLQRKQSEIKIDDHESSANLNDLESMSGIQGKINVSRKTKVRKTHLRSSSIELYERDSKQGEGMKNSGFGNNQTHFKKSNEDKGTEVKNSYKKSNEDKGDEVKNSQGTKRKSVKHQLSSQKENNNSHQELNPLKRSTKTRKDLFEYPQLNETIEQESKGSIEQIQSQEQFFPTINKDKNPSRNPKNTSTFFIAQQNKVVPKKKYRFTAPKIRNDRLSHGSQMKNQLSLGKTRKTQKTEITCRKSRQNQKILHGEDKEPLKKIPLKTYLSEFSRTSNQGVFRQRSKKMNHTLESVIFYRNKFSETVNSSLNQQYGLTMDFEVIPKNLEMQIFTIQDINNLYFSIEGAFQHEKSRKNDYKEAKQNLPKIKVTMKILTILASLHSLNQTYYEMIKNFLITPFQSVVSQQNYIMISKSGMNEIKIKEAVSKILFMHRTCPGDICEHLKQFIHKVESLAKNIEN